MWKLIVPVAALAGVLATAGAFAQDTQPQHGGMPQMAPMQGGMCGPTGCGTGTPAQGTPMQGMPMQGQAQGQGQGGMMMGGGCAMMQRSAAMEQRLRRLEERLGIQTPPAPPNTQPGAPG